MSKIPLISGRALKGAGLLAAVIIIAAAFLMPCPLRAGDIDAEALRAAFDASRKAEGKRLSDYELVDQDGVHFRLSDYYRDGRPLVIGFLYTGCPDVCPTITNELKKAVDSAREKFGDKFNVVNIGFDPKNDTPENLKKYGLHFTKDFAAFRFATAGPETIAALTREAGFFYARNKEGGFDHIDMATVLKPGGVVYRQVYSLRTRSGELIRRLDELITGKPPEAPSASMVDKLKYFCYKYDPAAGRYVVDYPMVAAFIMQSIVIGVIIIAVWGKRIKGLFLRMFRG